MGLCSSASKVLSSDRNEGTITFAELKGKSRQEKIKIVFDFLDANNNGVITLDEFMTTASRLTNAEVQNVRTEFEELAEGFVVHLEQFVDAHLKAYKGTAEDEVDKWVIAVCKRSPHSEVLLKKFGIHKAAADFLGGGSGNENKGLKEFADTEENNQKLLRSNIAEGREELSHLIDDLNNVHHRVEETLQRKAEPEQVKKKQKNNAYLINEEVGRLQDSIANMEFKSDEDDDQEDDGHVHKHHHRSKNKEESERQKHDHHHHHHHHHHHRRKKEGVS